jgi:hypothetical protein
MAQVIIYSHQENLEGRRPAISDAVHACVTEVLGLPPEKRFHRFVGLPPGDFIHPADRSLRYTILEIHMFAGRSEAVRKALIRSLFARFESDLGIAPQDLEVEILESPRSNWGIRGLPGDELALGYRVEK